MPNRTVQKRQEARLHRLAAATHVTVDRTGPGSVYSRTLRSLATLRREGRSPASESVLVRSGLILRPNPNVPADEDLSDRRVLEGPPPFDALISPNGIAHQLLLLLLFVVQHEKGASSERSGLVRTPFVAPDSEDVGLLDLVMPTYLVDPWSVATTGNTHSSAADRRRRQFTATLATLAKEGFIEAPNVAKGRNKYVGFRLLEETGPRPNGDPLRYKPPAATKRGVIAVPVDFFLNGWVHLLSPQEIMFWLMLRDRDAGGPIVIDAAERARRYGLVRGRYSSWWLLEHAGLITTATDAMRRPQGTVVDFDATKMPDPHVFTLTDDGLKNDAATRITAAVRARHSGDEPVGIARVNPLIVENGL